MKASNAVVVRGIAKEFGTGGSAARALRGSDLDVPFGQITMLVGPSGCGKTTLLSIIAGLLHPTSGSISVLDTDPFALRPGRRVAFRRANMGFVFQQYNLLPSLSASENAAVGLIAGGMRRAEGVRRAAAALERLGMSHRLDALPRQLSGGEQQRVAVARALVHEPRVLLCDEPTAALDAGNGRAVMAMLSAIAVHPDRAVLIVTHDSRIFDFAHRIAHMEDGRITAIEDRAQAA
jgi:putative ABC transport system ATP-binding protein